MKEWIQEQAYDERIDPERPWKRTINIKPFGQQLKEWGYRMPTKPKKQLSVFSHFCKLIAPYVKTYFESEALMWLLGPTATLSSSRILKKLISPISIYRMLYMKIVERLYFFHLNNIGLITEYPQFKEYCKQNPDKFWTFYMANVLDKGNFNKFKDNIVNDVVIGRLFVVGSPDWDLNDKDDAILFLMGEENVRDQIFRGIIQNEGCIKNDDGTVATNGQGDLFLIALTSGDKQTKKRNVKLLEKWKAIAREGTKKFFKDQIGELMENEDAYGRFQASLSGQVNPIDPIIEEAAPSSPVRSVETRTTQIRPPIEEPAEEEAAQEEEDEVL